MFSSRPARSLARFSSVAQKKLTDTEQVAFPSFADVVVIGGGVSGCSVAYHLAKLGVSNVVLLEKENITSGTTWHSLGMFWGLRPSDDEIELVQYTRNLAKNVLPEEVGYSSGWNQNGGLVLATTRCRHRMDEFKRLKSLGNYYGIESFVLSPQQTSDLHPFVCTQDLVGSFYTPGDGNLDTSIYVDALKRVAMSNGVKFVENCRVLNIQTEGSGSRRIIKQVDTTLGPIRTGRVVNSSGIWAQELGKLVDVDVPVCSLLHSYVFTNPIPGLKKLPNLRENGLYMKACGSFLAIGGYEKAPKRCPDTLPAFDLYDFDWDLFRPHYEWATARVPVVQKAGLTHEVCGAESFTPDARPIMGSTSLRGFFLSCGYSTAGVMLSGGCGRELASLIVNGRTTLDMFAFDSRRFRHGLLKNDTWISARSKESYAGTFRIAYPHYMPVASRNMIVSPNHEVLARHGCVFEERFGYEVPGWFRPDDSEVLEAALQHDNLANTAYEKILDAECTFDLPGSFVKVAEEHFATRNRVTVFDQSSLGKFVVSGIGATKALSWMCACKFPQCIGKTSYAIMCDKYGLIEADVTVSRIEDDQFGFARYYVVTSGARLRRVFDWMNSVIYENSFQCHVSDVSQKYGVLSVMGPLSLPVLQSLCTDDILCLETFPFCTNRHIGFAGVEVRAIRVTFVGEMGWELHVPADDSEKLLKRILTAGRSFGVALAGCRALESLSLEKCYRYLHKDLRTTDTPLEHGFDQVCDLPRPFLGKEALLKQRDRVHRRLVCLLVDASGTTNLNGMEAILADGVIVGYVRRAGYGHTVRKHIAYGMVKHPHVRNGHVTMSLLQEMPFQIERMGVLVNAELSLKAPFDPSGSRIKGDYSQHLA